MKNVVKHTTCGALLLLIMPIIVWISGWQWQPGNEGWQLYFLFLLTQTATGYWAVLSSFFLCGWFLWCLRCRWPSAVFITCILLTVIFMGQGVKLLIKDQVKASRPYVLWLENHYNISKSLFYQLKTKARVKMVTQLLTNNTQLPLWQKKHWALETGFAFPSGHSLLASSWALLGIGILWPRRHIKTVVVLFLWAIGVMTSRMLLGLHYPPDLVAAVIVSWSLITLATWLIQRIKNIFL